MNKLSKAKRKGNKMLIIILCVIGIILIGFLLGPRVKIDATIKPVKLMDDLDEYLSKNESAIENLIPGTEKKILWAGDKNKKTEYSIVYLHGFTTTRQEISPVTETIGRELGANIFFARLKDHGINDIDALGDATVNDWVNDAWEAYQIGKQIGEKIIFISMSAGGPLALWLCLKQEDKKDVVANIILSPMFEPFDPTARLLLLPWGNKLIKLILGDYREIEPLNEMQAKFSACKYPSEALLTMMGICKFSWGLPLESLTVPSLCLYTDNDNVVSVPRMKKELARADQQLITFERIDAKHHCIAGDVMSPETNDVVIQKIMQYLSITLSLKTK